MSLNEVLLFLLTLTVHECKGCFSWSKKTSKVGAMNPRLNSRKQYNKLDALVYY